MIYGAGAGLAGAGRGAGTVTSTALWYMVRPRPGRGAFCVYLTSILLAHINRCSAALVQFDHLFSDHQEPYSGSSSVYT